LTLPDIPDEILKVLICKEFENEDRKGKGPIQGFKLQLLGLGL
jgi:hypothetical protein